MSARLASRNHSNKCAAQSDEWETMKRHVEYGASFWNRCAAPNESVTWSPITTSSSTGQAIPRGSSATTSHSRPHRSHRRCLRYDHFRTTYKKAHTRKKPSRNSSAAEPPSLIRNSCARLFCVYATFQIL